MTNVTERFVDYLFSKVGNITKETEEKAVACKQDYMAVTAAGARKNASRWAEFLKTVPSGPAKLIGCDISTDERTAALINGFNAHSLELDDGQRFAMIHLGASVISAVNAACDRFGFREKAYRKGIIMGYEAACRVAITMQPSHKKRGYHAAGTCGTIGSAVGTAFAMGLDKAQMKRVLTLAAGSSAGMLEMQEQGSEVKPFNVGRAAMDGLTAAYMGVTDYAVPDDLLGGKRGFFRTFSDTYDADKLTEETGYFEIERIYVKPYASCRHSHSAVEAAIKLHAGIYPDDIASVLVETYKLGVQGHDHTDIQGIASAKLSTPYAVAAALQHGRADLTVFEPLDPKAVDLARKIRVIEKEELTKECPQKRIAVVTVTCQDGSRKVSRVDYAKGEPENPMTKAEMEEKERMLLAYAADYR